jgi:hypothetical protein
VFAAVDHLSWDDSIIENPPFVIDVLQKKVQRRNTLRQPMLHLLPLCRRNDAWDQVIREDFFGALVSAIHRECDALIQKAEIGRVFPALELVRRQGREVFKQRLTVRM